MNDESLKLRKKCNRALRRKGRICGMLPIFMWLLAAGVLTSCLPWPDETTADAPEPWSAEILNGAQHLGTGAVANWPPPLGKCIEGRFVLEDLPIDHDTGQTEPEVSLAFQHAGDQNGLLEINGVTVWSRVTLLDKLANAIADVLAEVIVCTVESAFPGDPSCDGVAHYIETTYVSRTISTADLSIGNNNYRICATDGDFLIADGVQLKESFSASDETNGDAGPDATTDDSIGNSY